MFPLVIQGPQTQVSLEGPASPVLLSVPTISSLAPEVHSVSAPSLAKGVSCSVMSGNLQWCLRGGGHYHWLVGFLNLIADKYLSDFYRQPGPFWLLQPQK